MTDQGKLLKVFFKPKFNSSN